MQTFKKLFVFMLIASAMAPALAMEPVMEPARVEMKDEARSDEENKTPSPVRTPSPTAKIKAMGTKLVETTKGLVDRLKAVLDKPDSSADVDSVPAVKSLDGVPPIMLIQGGQDAVEVSLEVPAEALVIEEEAIVPASLALPESDDEAEVEEVAPVTAIVVQQPVPVNPVAGIKAQPRISVSRFDALKAVAVARFPFLGSFLPGRTNAPVKKDSLIVREEVVEEDADITSDDFADLFSQVEEVAAPVVVEEATPAPVVEEVAATPAPVADAPATPTQATGEPVEKTAAPQVSAEVARLAEVLAAAQAALAAAPADAANRAELQAAVDAAQAAVNAAANPVVAPAQKTFAGKAKAFISDKAKAVKDFYAFDENAKAKSIGKYVGTAALVAAIAGGSYALYNYIFGDEKTVEEVKAVEAPVKTTVAEAPVVAKPAVNNSGSRGNWHCKKHCSKNVRVKCRGKKSCGNNGCK